MATLKQSLDWAKQNPEDPRTDELIKRVQSGGFDDQARQEGLDLSSVSPTFKTSQPQAQQTPFASAAGFLGNAAKAVGKGVQQATVGAAGALADTALGGGQFLTKGLEYQAKAKEGIASKIGLPKPQQSESEAWQKTGQAMEGLKQNVKAIPQVQEANQSIAGNIGALGADIATFWNPGGTATKAVSAGKSIMEGVGKNLNLAALPKTVGWVSQKLLNAIPEYAAGYGYGKVKGQTEAQAEGTGLFFAGGSVVGEAAGAAWTKAKGSLGENVSKALGFIGNMKAPQALAKVAQSTRALKVISTLAPDIKVKDANGIEKVFEPTKATFHETLQAWSQTAKSIYKDYTAAAKQAGDQGAAIIPEDWQKLIAGLGEFTKDSTAAFKNKAASLIKDIQDNFGKDEFTDLNRAQTFVERLNKDINPVSDKAASEVSKKLSQDLREIMDNKIIQSTGEQYQVMRNSYSDLKSIEKDLVNQFKKGARGIGKNIGNWVEGFGTIDTILGALGGSPKEFVKGSLWLSLGKIMKTLRDPEWRLQNAFKMLEEGKPRTPGQIRMTGGAPAAELPKVDTSKIPMGLSLKDVSGEQDMKAVKPKTNILENAGIQKNLAKIQEIFAARKGLVKITEIDKIEKWAGRQLSHAEMNDLENATINVSWEKGASYAKPYTKRILEASKDEAMQNLKNYVNGKDEIGIDVFDLESDEGKLVKKVLTPEQYKEIKNLNSRIENMGPDSRGNYDSFERDDKINKLTDKIEGIIKKAISTDKGVAKVPKAIEAGQKKTTISPIKEYTGGKVENEQAATKATTKAPYKPEYTLEKASENVKTGRWTYVDKGAILGDDFVHTEPTKAKLVTWMDEQNTIMKERYEERAREQGMMIEEYTGGNAETEQIATKATTNSAYKTTVIHATTAESKASILKNGFDLKKGGEGWSLGDTDPMGIYFHPSQGAFKDYAINMAETPELIKGPQIKAKLELNNPLKLTSQEQWDSILKAVPKSKDMNQAVTDYLKSLGYDGVIDKEGFMGMMDEGQIVAFDPKQVHIIKEAEAPKLSTYQESGPLTTKVLKKLEGRSSVSRQFISDLTNSPDLKQQEKDIIRNVLDAQKGDTIPVADFAKKVQAELLPLKVRLGGSSAMKSVDDYRYNPRYEQISLPDDLRGKVKNYREKVYQSSVSTSAGGVHFGSDTKNYFGHTRIEDMADNSTRRVIEVQSDLYQKGRLESEMGDVFRHAKDENEGFGAIARRLGNGDEIKGNYKIQELNQEQLKPLQQYNDPTAHFRMVREEIKQAAKDGKTKLQFPTGETAMKIEGLGVEETFQITDQFSHLKGKKFDDAVESFLNDGGNLPTLSLENIKVGQQIMGDQGEFVITDVLGDGKFKAVTKREYDNIGAWKIVEDVRGNGEKVWLAKNPKTGETVSGATKEYAQTIIDTQKENSQRLAETFDISGKVDTSNPIYKFYEKDLGKYLKNRHGAQLITDKQGVTWWEVPITKEMGKLPVEAFGIAALPLGMAASSSDNKKKATIPVAK